MWIAMLDYWLNKLMFDLQGPDAKDRWTNRRRETIDQYPLSPELKKALMDDDFATIHPKANPYLMRTYLLMCGLDDAASIKALSTLRTKEDEERVNG